MPTLACRQGRDEEDFSIGRLMPCSTLDATRPLRPAKVPIYDDQGTNSQSAIYE